MAMVRYTEQELDQMAGLTDWEYLQNMTDSSIDYSDIPETTDEMLARAVRGNIPLVAPQNSTRFCRSTNRNRLMKKIALILFLGFFALKSFAQAGDLTIGAQGGYITYYKNALYGLNLSYAPSDPLQLSLSSILNPKIIRADALNPNGQIENSLFALNLDARFLILNFDSWAVGPSVGVQYLHNKEKITLENTYDRIGVNLGVYAKVNLTENLRLGGGWQYSSLKDSESYNMFYLSLGWAFNLR